MYKAYTCKHCGEVIETYTPLQTLTNHLIDAGMIQPEMRTKTKLVDILKEFTLEAIDDDIHRTPDFEP